MKLNKFFIGLGIATVMLFTACSTEVDGPVYTPNAQNVSFETKTPDAITTAEDSYTVNVRVIRSNTKGSYTMNYSSSATANGVFTDDKNGQVTFEDGQAVATIKVTAANLQKGKTYVDTLKLSDNDIANADTLTKTANSYTIVKIVSDYTWVSAGTCTFIDGFWDDGEAENVKIVKAKEKPSLHRILDPWKTIYKSVNSSNIEFTLNSDNSISFQNGLNGNVNGYYMYWNTVNYSSYCTITQNKNDFTVTALYVSPSNSLGAGCDFRFIWDGWPGM